MLLDWFIGAVFLRNVIWDHLHRRPDATPLNNVDLVYFGLDDLSREIGECFVTVSGKNSGIGCDRGLR
ncbi:nucleotidyltransferase family protein [Kistimonas scapharcae]|uniref:nucleotidyltransferase family protein n=1 Tax=Kistimonas scapharcae TaxID=1036133 RepID=UPI0031EBD49C